MSTRITETALLTSPAILLSKWASTDSGMNKGILLHNHIQGIYSHFRHTELDPIIKR